MAQAKAKSPAPSVTVKKIVSASREEVFDAWTKPEIMSKWFFPRNNAEKAEVKNDLRVGGTYTNVMTLKPGEVSSCTPEGTGKSEDERQYEHHGEYLELSRPDRIVFTWNSHSVTDSVVTVTLRDVGGATEVTVMHELPSEDNVPGHETGWIGCLENLATFLG